MRLILINIGQAWPGINDMKDVGNPAKFGIVIVENEVQTPKGWTMLREQEGFPKGVSTVSVYASQSYRQVMKHSIKPYIEEATFEQMKTALTADASQWGEELVFVLSPSLAEALARAGYTVEGLKTALLRREGCLENSSVPALWVLSGSRVAFPSGSTSFPIITWFPLSPVPITLNFSWPVVEGPGQAS